jgi:hypothetical protein
MARQFNREASMAGRGPEALVDLERYPLADLEAPAGQALVESCRTEFEAKGVLVLADFLRPEAAAAARFELAAQLGEAYYCEKAHNPYLSVADPAYPPDHARNRLQVTDVGCLADDLIAPESVLRQLYLWDKLQAFIAAIIGVPRLYPYADPLGSLNVNVFQPGQQHGWHFDNADYAFTLMLQPAQAGGVYEYVPWIRSPETENYAAVQRVLDGVRDEVNELAMGVGALVLFRGRYSLHRVTPVEGARPRLVAVLSYDTQPGVMLSEHNRRLFYGRVA